MLRIGISLVFLWFGSQQFLHPEQWIGFIPQWVINVSPVSPTTLIHFNGALELVFGTSLLIGFFTRISALILALHMSHITAMIGYDSTGVRDFGLSIATWAIFLNGADPFSFDYYLFFMPKILKIQAELQKSSSSIPSIKYAQGNQISKQ